MMTHVNIILHESQVIRYYTTLASQEAQLQHEESAEEGCECHFERSPFWENMLATDYVLQSLGEWKPDRSNLGIPIYRYTDIPIYRIPRHVNGEWDV